METLETAHTFLLTCTFATMAYFAIGFVFGWLRWHEANKTYTTDHQYLFYHFRQGFRVLISVSSDHLRWYHFLLYPSLLPSYLDNQRFSGEIQLTEKIHLNFDFLFIPHHLEYAAWCSLTWPIIMIGHVVSLLLSSAIGIIHLVAKFRHQQPPTMLLK